MSKDQNQKFDAETLIVEAQEITGLNDFGEPAFTKPLKALLARVNDEIKFKANGYKAFKTEIIRLLVNRLQIQEDLRNHPEILEEKITRPIIIIGSPRSGTTKLQRMLSAAPGVQKCYLWRLLNPGSSSRPDAGLQESQKPVTSFETGLGSQTTRESKEFQAAHETGLNEVEESIHLIDFSLNASIEGLGTNVPLFFYSEWLQGAEERPVDINAYSFMRTLLQYLQWQDGGAHNRPWILKAPSHTAHVSALMNAFPDATLVQTHRNPVQAVPSAAKLMNGFWSISHCTNAEKVAQGMFEWMARGLDRCLAAREQFDLDKHILDVKYNDIRLDIMPVIEEIYKRNGRELNNDARKSMLAWESNNEQGKRGEHSYSLEEFNLDKVTIQNRFAAYRERFEDYF